MRFDDFVIEQIMPADSWSAVWEDGLITPLIGWALISNPAWEDKEVTGLYVMRVDQEVATVWGADGFKGYVRREEFREQSIP